MPIRIARTGVITACRVLASSDAVARSWVRLWVAAKDSTTARTAVVSRSRTSRVRVWAESRARLPSMALSSPLAKISTFGPMEARKRCNRRFVAMRCIASSPSLSFVSSFWAALASFGSKLET